MCAVCRRAPRQSAKETMEQVAAAIKKGASPEHFNDLLDALAGTPKTVQADPELDEAWERGRR